VWRFNTTVEDITLYVEDKGGHHSVFGHIPVQKEKYYIIRIKKWLFGNRLLHLPCIYIQTDEQNDQVQLPVILRIFDEDQNPVDIHTSIMCINILQNIKAVGGDSQTNHALWRCACPQDFDFHQIFDNDR
jgi:hypothetical protein